MDQHLISVDELRAAGALDVPAAWRKSLGGERGAERDLFTGLDDDDRPSPEPRTRVELDTGDDASPDAEL